jgi:hypothetical protein
VLADVGVSYYCATVFCGHSSSWDDRIVFHVTRQLSATSDLNDPENGVDV